MTLDQKLQLLMRSFAGQETFTFNEALNLLGQNESTTTWTLWKLVKNGDLNRQGRGLYAFGKRLREFKPKVSAVTEIVVDALKSSRIKFFVSGIDAIKDLIIDIPEKYPSIVFVEEGKEEKAKKVLWGTKKQLIVITESEVKDYYTFKGQPAFEKRKLVVLSGTNEMLFQKDGIAIPEKAFVDLYFEVSRRLYPYPLVKLAETYAEMKKKIALDPVKMIRIASRRSIQHDIRYILEYDLIKDTSFEFVKTLRSFK